MSKQRFVLTILILASMLSILLTGCTPETDPTVTAVATQANSEPTQTATEAATATTAPTFTPEPTAVSEEGEPVEGWVGHIYSTPNMAQYDDYFESVNGTQYGIEPLDDEIKEQLEAVRDSDQLVGITGMLFADRMDYNNSQIVVSLIVPYGEEEISNWTGTLHSNGEGAQFDDYFTLSDPEVGVYGTTSFGIDSLDTEISAQLEALRDTDQEFTISGTLHRLAIDAYGFQIEVTELLVDDMLWCADPIEWATYTNDEYGFSIDYPADWQVTEREAGDPGAGFTYAASVEFANDDVRLIIQVRQAGSDNIFSYAPGAGDWGEDGTIEIAGTEVQIIPLVADSNTKEIYYGGTSGFAAGNLEFGISLSSNGTEDYASLDLDSSMISIAKQALQTLSLEGQQTSLETPEIIYSEVEAWNGVVIKTELGNQYDIYFERDDGPQYGISGGSDAIAETLEQAAWTGATIRVWGTLNENVPAMQNRLIVVDRIDFLDDAATTSRNLSLFATASASSTLTEGKKTFSPIFAIDGNDNSCWVEGADGSGEGEWLELEFPSEIRIDSIHVVNGFTDPTDLYEANARPRVVELIFDSTSVEVELEDSLSLQSIDLADQNITTQTVRMRIKSVYEGTAYEDACLSEFQVWGYVIPE